MITRHWAVRLAAAGSAVLLALCVTGCSSDAPAPAAAPPTATVPPLQDRALSDTEQAAVQFGLAMESALIEDGAYPTDPDRLRDFVSLPGTKVVSLETAPTGEYGAYVLCVERKGSYAVYEGLEGEVTEFGEGTCPDAAS